MADSPELDREIAVLRASLWSESDPEGRAFATLADACRRKGDLDEARALVSDGLGRHPQFATGHLVAARIARDGGDHVRAREHFDRVLDLDGANVLALVERAECSLAEGDREGALTDLRDALRLEPTNQTAKARLEAAEDGDRWRPALVETEDVPVAPDPEAEGPIVTRTMGDIYARQGFLEEAIQVYENLLRKSPEDEALTTRLSELRDAVTGGSGGSGGGLDADDRDTPGSVDAEERPVDVPEEGSAVLRSGAPEVVPAPQAEAPAPLRDDETEPLPATPAGAAFPVLDPQSADRRKVRSIAQYFDDLLAWVPGAVPVESLAPADVHDAVPIESLAPDTVPDAVPIESLAPDTVPDAVPVETLAPAESGAESDAGGAPAARDHDDSDDFTRWLKGLST